MFALSQEVLWTDRLRAYAAHVQSPGVLNVRRRDVAQILSDVSARRRFIYQWRIRLAYFRWCQRKVGRFCHDPEYLDEAVIELGAYAQCVDRAAWPKLHGVLDELHGIADETRILRQRVFVARAQQISTT